MASHQANSFRKLLPIALLLFSASATSQRLAITFDDAPTPDTEVFTGEERSRRILNHLQRSGVRQAAFFVLTQNVQHEKGISRLHAYAQAGHVLANHSHTHGRIEEAGLQRYIDDIRTADSILSEFTAYSKWYRYPYLDEGRTIATRDSIRKALREIGLRNGYVTIDNYDWYLNHLLVSARREGRKVNLNKLRDVYIQHIYESIRFYDAIALKHLGRSPRHVLLLHENDLAALFLGDLVAYLQKKGCLIISVEDAYADPLVSHIPDVLFNGQGRVAAIAREKGVHPRELVQEAEDEVYLQKLVERRKTFK